MIRPILTTVRSLPPTSHPIISDSPLIRYMFAGKQDPLPEPEALDLPDDLQLDDGEAKEDEHEEENPFDIDTMKGKR